MGIGRRNFLKMFGTTIATASVNPLQAVLVSEDLYINRALGISFQKPAGWHFPSIKEFAQLKNQQVLKDDDLSDQLRGADEPLVVISKLDPTVRSIGPAITVYVEPFLLEEGETLLDVIPELEPVYQRVLKDYKQIGLPVEKSISNCESAEYYSEFLFEQQDICVVARNRSVISVRKPQIYTVNMFDYPEISQTAQREYSEFLKSMYFV